MVPVTVRSWTQTEHKHSVLYLSGTRTSRPNRAQLFYVTTSCISSGFFSVRGFHVPRTLGKLPTVKFWLRWLLNHKGYWMIKVKAFLSPPQHSQSLFNLLTKEHTSFCNDTEYLLALDPSNEVLIQSACHLVKYLAVFDDAQSFISTFALMWVKTCMHIQKQSWQTSPKSWSTFKHVLEFYTMLHNAH